MCARACRRRRERLYVKNDFFFFSFYNDLTLERCVRDVDAASLDRSSLLAFFAFDLDCGADFWYLDFFFCRFFSSLVIVDGDAGPRRKSWK